MILRVIRLAYVQWCLSDGEDWIFGTLKRGMHSRSLPPMSICDGNLEESIKNILKMLILWVSIPHTLTVFPGYSIGAKLDFVSNGLPS